MPQDITLAVPQPMLPPTREEQEAITLMKKRSAPLSEERLRQLAELGKQPDPEPVRDLLIEKMRAEIAKMEAEQ